MSKGTVPIVTCDHESGCTEWTLDYFAMAVSAVNGVQVMPIPEGWSTGLDPTYGTEHYCPEHTRVDSDSGIVDVIEGGEFTGKRQYRELLSEKIAHDTFGCGDPSCDC